MKKVSELITETLDTSCQVPLNEAGMALNRLLTKHAEAGYIIVSASRHEYNESENKYRYRELRRDIRDAGYSFKPVEGGYVESSATGPVEKTEKSFVVFCYDKLGRKGDFGELRKFALEMCRKYEQESVLVAEPGENPVYLDENEKVEAQFSDKVTVNRAVELFFTRLGNTRFTFKESRMEDWHSVMDRHCRYLMGEIF